MKRPARLLSLVALVAITLTTLGRPASVEAASWKYTALGDSLATGGSIFLALKPYVPRYRDYIQTDTGNRVSLTNLGQNGWTSGDLLNALTTNSTFRGSVSSSQVVTWDIGGNDLRPARDSYKNKTCGGDDNQECLRATVKAFRDHWDGIVAQARAPAQHEPHHHPHDDHLQPVRRPGPGRRYLAQ